MQVAMKKSVVAARPSARSSVKVVCQAGATERVQIAAASAVAAALLVSAPAHAGVVLAKPELKKLFQDDGAAAAVSTSSAAPAASKAAAAAKPKAAPAPKVKAEPTVSSMGSDIDPRSIALPGAILAVGGGLAAAYKLDAGWADFFREAMVRDSNNFAGYEPELKPEGGYTGTRKVKASGTKKGLFGFGKK